MVSSMAIIASDPEHRFSVSIELENTFLKPAPVGTKVFIVSNILRMGKAIATAEVRFTDQVRRIPVNGILALCTL
jgi:acyl-coenzyme A thioesterase PaaI-like protein